MDRLPMMKAYCRLVEQRSFSKAASDIGISPALLSKEIKLLENSLNRKLLIRSTRKLSLTEQGQHYYQRALRLLDDFDPFEEEVRLDTQQARGELKINAPLSYGLTKLSPILTRSF